MQPTDYLFNHTLYARYNPENNPTTADVCVRRVPLDKIKPEYLEKEGKLAERFCAGVWSGFGTFTRLSCHAAQVHSTHRREDLNAQD